MEKKELTSPTFDVQKELDALTHAEREKINFCGKTRSIGWMRPGTQEMFTHISFKEKDALKRGVKIAACILLNDMFIWWRKIVYPLYWRWLYYIEDISMPEIVALQDAAKKKLPRNAYVLNTILTTGMLRTMMATRAEEVLVSPVEQDGEQHIP